MAKEKKSGKTLVVVEAPGKVAKIQKYLGNSYLVVPTAGHIMDLPKKDAIDLKNGFEPNFVVNPDKKDIIEKLKKAHESCDDVIIFTDLDREGSGIGYLVCKLLKINPKTVKRAITNEITEKAVKKAIENPEKLDLDMVDAFFYRRVLDRTVGFSLSPLLWKIQQNLSAGRVQSVSLRMIVEIEKEHRKFNAEANYKVVGIFDFKDKKNKIHSFKTTLNKRFDSKEEAKKFLNNCINKNFFVKSIETKESKKNPPIPFITSSLQQEANKRFGFSVDRVMQICQKLYENSWISYHRTDSPILSEEASNAIHQHIRNKFGEKYLQPRNFKAKETSQAAHECCRHTHFETEFPEGLTSDEQKIYTLIYNRTLSSQMSTAVFDKTTALITADKLKEDFVASGLVLKFDGYLKLYQEETEEDLTDEDSDENKTLPKMENGDNVSYSNIDAFQVFTKPSPRLTEASLVKKLEELQIGRPSTFSNIIHTLTSKRGYVEKKSLPANKRNIVTLQLSGDKISETIKEENYGLEKNKLIPTDVGMIVVEYLIEKFPKILDYKFTANVEGDFDKVAKGELEWKKSMSDFYVPFIESVNQAKQEKDSPGIRLIGIDPNSGKNVYARLGKFGPMIQLGEAVKQEKGKVKADSDTKFAKLPEDKSIETITMEEAIQLLVWPRNLGEYKSKPITVAIGKYGPYIKYDGRFIGLKDTEFKPEEITLKQASELIKNDDSNGGAKKGVVKEFDEIKVMEGQYGPYIKYKNVNYKVPAGTDAGSLTKDACMEIIAGGKPKSKTPFKKKKK